MSSLEELQKELPDCVEAHKEGYIGIIPVEENEKRCRQIGWTNKDFLDDCQYWEGNFGLLLKEQIGCADIDGRQTQRDNKHLCSDDKEYTKKIFGDIAREALQDYAIIVETASPNGLHLYYRTEEKNLTDKAHAFVKKFCYPWDFEIEELAGQSLEAEIEIFLPNGSRQMVAPSSEIKGKRYRVSDKSKFKEFLKLPPIKYDDILSKLEEALLKHGFTLKSSDGDESEIAKKYNVDFVKQDDRMLPSYYIDKMADFLILGYKENHGAKHNMTLAVSGYFHRFINEESALKIGETIIQKEPLLFEDNDAFLTTLASSYHNNKTIQSGGKTLYEEYFKDICPSEEFWFKLITYTNANVKFRTTNIIGNSWTEIQLNQKEHQVEQQSWGQSKKGESYLKKNEPVLGFQIIDVRRIKNPVIKDAAETFELYYIPSGLNTIRCIAGSSMKELEEELKQQVGLVLSNQFKNIFNMIIVKFQKINFINTSVSSSVPGIFEIDGEIRRFDYNKNEVPPKYSKIDLIAAIDLLNQIKDIFPTDTSKLGHICRIGLLLPFYHILKSNGHLAKFLILAQAGGTLKSTISEMIVNFYNPSKTTTKQANIFNGGQFGSVYQVGEKFGISSYPFVVNEPATALQDQEIVEILKSAIESDVARVTHDGAYYSYGTAILSTNVDIQQTDAFLRRSNVFYFNASERATQQDIDNIAELLNENKINDRFQELAPIGDFCFTYLSNHKNLFNEMSVEELELHLVSKIEEVTGEQLDWMKVNAAEDTIQAIEEIDDEVLDSFLQQIKDDYNAVFKIYQTINLDKDEDAPLSYPFNKDGLITIIARGVCSILDYNSNNDKIIISGNKIKNYFKNQYNKIVTSASLYEELLPFADEYDIKKGRFYQNKKQVRGIRVEPELIVDLLNNDIRDDENE